MGYDMFDMWDAMKRTSYTRVIEELEESIDDFDGDGDEIIKLFLDKVSAILHTEASSFWIYHVSGDGLIRPHAYNGGKDIGSIRLFPGEGIVGNVILTGESVIVEDCSKDPNFASRVDDSTGFVTRTMICVPTVFNDMAFGCIQLINKKDGSYFDEQDLELAQNLSNKIVELLSKKNGLEKYGFGTNDGIESGTRRGSIEDLAIVFIDMVGYTELSNSVETIILANVIHNYMTYVSDIVTKYNGHFDKIMCDRIQAFWGAPDKVENPVYNACKAAMEIVECLDELKSLIYDKYGVDIALKVGVTYGRTFVGNIGHKHCLDYTVVGKEVSLAKLVAVSCQPNTVNITREVLDKLSYSCDFDYKRAEKLKVGKKSLDIYRLMDI